MAWEPKNAGEGMFSRLSDAAQALMEEHARLNLPPSEYWRNVVHPVAAAIWRQRIEAGEDIDGLIAARRKKLR